ncbi:MAG: sporulation protein [Polaromonas sp.]|nr:sporulation protein [Polaromonas sp.]
MKIPTGRHTGGKQAGGTLLGLVLGALLGLGAALAVAVYVTKVPVPFLNKGATRGAPNDAAEAQKNKDWDPNAALTGKNAPRPPVATGNLGTLETPAVGVPSPAVVITPPQSNASAGRSVRAVPADPLGDLANARAAAARPAAPPDAADTAANPGADPFNYFIQVGAFRTPEDAEQQRAKLLLLGFQARVTEREQSGRTVYRVRLGPFDRKDEADKVKEKLDGNSVETALVRVQR